MAKFWLRFIRVRECMVNGLYEQWVEGMEKSLSYPVEERAIRQGEWSWRNII